MQVRQRAKGNARHVRQRHAVDFGHPLRFRGDGSRASDVQAQFWTAKDAILVRPRVGLVQRDLERPPRAQRYDLRSLGGFKSFVREKAARCP